METKDFSAKELQELAGESEPEKVCTCEKVETGYWTIENGTKVYKTYTTVRYHMDDCSFFEDYSNSESGYVY